MRSDAAGFTLLEVLAAVAILGIAYAQLGQSGIMGLQHEGEARRRIHASLLADSVLTELESMIEAGTAPPIGTDEREEEGFRIAIAVDAFTLDVPEEEQAGNRLSNARSRLGGDEAAAPQPVAGPSLLGGGGPGATSPLRAISVEVAWDEGFGERSVRRTTYALDPEAAAGTLQGLAQGAAAAAQQGTGGTQPQSPNRPEPQP